MFRKDLIPLLLDHPLSVGEIAALMDEHPRDVASDLEHLLKSLRHEPYRAVITPARCRKCGFTFREHKLRRPGRCPKCRESHIDEALIMIEKTA
jgi:predicted Zn-ribbon and HTH transcriptional regulator